MKTVAIAALGLCAAAGSASAFVAPGPVAARGVPQRLRMSEVEEPVEATAEEPVEVTPAAVPTTTNVGIISPGMSVAVPFLERPAGLDSFKLAGDYGFDPLGFAKDKESLIKYREAEIKHARLAMLAAAGWIFAERFDAGLAGIFGVDSPVADIGGFSPSVLNGGLDKVSPFYWGGVVAFTAAIEIYGAKVKAGACDDSYTPGDFSFDPLGYYPVDKESRFEMQEKEIKNGRLAMLAIVGFAVQEFVTKVPVAAETPFFFEPITKFMSDFSAANGYLQ